MLNDLKSDLRRQASADKARVLSRFFKTGRGEYGEGDRFLGVNVPVQRTIARRYSGITTGSLQKLLASAIHEHRFTALLILVIKYQKAGEYEREKLFRLYLRNLKHANNWDLIDLSADKILGTHMLDRDRSLLYELAQSDNLWNRRASIMATFTFIRNGQFKDTLRIAEILMHDSHDLIHKAVGWMLREIGKRDLEVEERFLLKYHQVMPRTMLRYAIEKFDPILRSRYLGQRAVHRSDDQHHR